MSFTFSSIETDVLGVSLHVEGSIVLEWLVDEVFAALVVSSDLQ